MGSQVWPLIVRSTINSNFDCCANKLFVKGEPLCSVKHVQRQLCLTDMPSSTGGGRYSRPIHSLVLDTAPLLTSPYGQIKSFNATNYYTVPLAKEEVKDETARAALEIWGNELRVRQPLAKSIQEGIFCHLDPEG